jgi:hypothetical protein
MSWVMQVQVKNEKGKPEWRDVRPSGSSEPYRYESEDQAWRVLWVIYPGNANVRVREDQP